jgi:hypothetical protein
VGVNLETINVKNIIHGNFYLTFKLIKNKSDNFEWILIAVYGAAQEEEKDSFLWELVQAWSVENLALRIVFYGNLYKLEAHMKKTRCNDRHPLLFNVVINNLDLRELELSWRQYTWANNLQMTTYEKLDIILVSTKWELKYPKVIVHTLTRELSGPYPFVARYWISNTTKFTYVQIWTWMVV